MLLTHQKPAVRVLVAALLLGVAGDALLRVDPIGLNLALWTTLVIGAVILLSRDTEAPMSAEHRALAGVAIVFAAMLAWRASPALAALNILGALSAMSVLCFALAEREWSMSRSLPSDYARAAIHAGFHAAGGALPLVLNDVPLRELTGTGRLRTAGAVGRGIAISVPLLFVFAALLTSADPIFARFMSESFRPEQWLSHLLLFGATGALAGGYLRGALLARKALGFGPQPPLPRLGIVEITIALGLIDLLFLAFVLVQMRYLFGGAALVQSTAGMTYAEYARSGFSELVTVAALVLPVLLAAHALLRTEQAGEVRRFRLLAATMLVLLFVIIGSAMQRMRMYQAEYGLTESRVYATAFMLWLVAVFAWLAATVLRGRATRFSVGAFAAGWGMVFALNAANPDDLIVRTNAHRAIAGRELDTTYATSLSADAVPATLRAIAALPPETRCAIGARLRARYGRRPQTDWRTWNWGRSRAAATLAERPAECALPGLSEGTDVTRATTAR